ncbi:MAG: S-layer homology domain-containing protein, partial [Firmicutes bacterium]|nr:S-layer homology domain-containing protein [Bacillota bacterium]
EKQAEYWGISIYNVSVVNPRESYYGSGDDWWDVSEEYSGLLGLLVGNDAMLYVMDNYPVKAYLAVPSEEEIPRAAADYADLDDNAWYYGAAEWVIDGDIAMGTEQDRFAPGEACSRAQTVTWLWRAAGMPEPETTDSPFRDVTKDDYFYYAALWAAENGIVNGVADGEFAPARTVTRAQMAAMLYRYEKLTRGGFTGAWAFPLGYADADEVPEYAYEAFCWLTMNGVFKGDGSGLHPLAACTRAQAACVLQRYFEQ